MYVYSNYLPYAFTSGAFLIATALYLSLPEPPPERVEPLLPIDKFKRAVRKVQAVRWIGGEVMFASQKQLTRKESVVLSHLVLSQGVNCPQCTNGRLVRTWSLLIGS